MITYYLTIRPYNNVSSARIIPTVPFFGRSHAQRGVQKKNFHFVFIERFHIFTCKDKRISCRNSLNHTLYFRHRVRHIVQQEAICNKPWHTSILNSAKLYL